jgi:hypothetical protein
MTIIVTDPSPSPGRRALYPALELDSGTDFPVVRLETGPWDSS